MKPRARRVTIGAATLVALVVAVPVVANWDTVRDHVEAWWFQLTRKTKTIEAYPGRFIVSRVIWKSTATSIEQIVFGLAAEELRCPIIFDPQEVPPLRLTRSMVQGSISLKKSGYRLLEQRFPRRAYVAIRDGAAPEESSPVMWDGVDLPVPTE